MVQATAVATSGTGRASSRMHVVAVGTAAPASRGQSAAASEASGRCPRSRAQAVDRTPLGVDAFADDAQVEGARHRDLALLAYAGARASSVRRAARSPLNSHTGLDPTGTSCVSYEPTVQLRVANGTHRCIVRAGGLHVGVRDCGRRRLTSFDSLTNARDARSKTCPKSQVER